MQPMVIQIRKLVFLMLVCVLMACGNWRGFGPTAQDAEEAEVIWETFLEIYEGDDHNEAFGFGCYTVGDYSEITIYGIVDTAEQDRVIEILTDIKQAQNARPMVVSFYEKEIWETTHFKDGSSASQRGEEVLLRKETIE